MNIYAEFIIYQSSPNLLVLIVLYIHIRRGGARMQFYEVVHTQYISSTSSLCAFALITHIFGGEAAGVPPRRGVKPYQQQQLVLLACARAPNEAMKYTFPLC